MRYEKNKQLAAVTMLEAYGQTCRAYYLDPSNANLAAHQACRAAMEKMLELYFMGNDEKAREGER